MPGDGIPAGPAPQAADNACTVLVAVLLRTSDALNAYLGTGRWRHPARRPTPGTPGRERPPTGRSDLGQPEEQRSQPRRCAPHADCHRVHSSSCTHQAGRAAGRCQPWRRRPAGRPRSVPPGCCLPRRRHQRCSRRPSPGPGDQTWPARCRADWWSWARVPGAAVCPRLE